jgi:hypothetical protein
MADFKGARAAVQAIQFILDHFAVFLKLTLTWAAISTALTFLFCELTHPAGFGASLGANLAALNGEANKGSKLADSFLGLLGTMVVSVRWLQFVVLEREPRNPLYLSHEIGSYFARSLQIALLAALPGIPGIIGGIILYAIGGWFGPLIAGVAILASLVVMVVVYSRLCITLVGAAVEDTLPIRRAFEISKGHAVALTTGLFLSYIVPLVVMVLVLAFFGMFEATEFRDAAEIVEEAVTNLCVLFVMGVFAGFTANAYIALVPGVSGDKIAKTFA